MIIYYIPIGLADGTRTSMAIPSVRCTIKAILFLYQLLLLFNLYLIHVDNRINIRVFNPPCCFSTGRNYARRQMSSGSDGK